MVKYGHLRCEEIFAMSLLAILEFPDRRLRLKARPVAEITDTIRALAKDMLETMYAAPGIGLAAIQVSQPIQLIVLDISEEKNQPMILINPRLVPLGDERSCYDEGCLSVPGFYETVERPAKVQVQALNEHAEPIEFVAEGLLATCIQHECDHLNGKLFVDYLTTLKRERIRKKLEKQHKDADGRA